MLSSLYPSHFSPFYSTEARPTRLLQNFNSPNELKQLHAHLLKTNSPISSLPLNRVALVCALTPSAVYAHQILQLAGDLENSSWNSCLRSFAEGGSPADAILLFYKLRELDVIPDCFTCSFVLKACTQLVDFKNGRIVHGYVEKLGLQSNLLLPNMIVHLYAVCGAMGDAQLLFEKMSQRDIVTWNIMIAQLVKREDIVGAHDFFSRMPGKNVRSWTSMIAGYVQCRKPEQAIDLFLEMELEGIMPNEVTFVAVLAACADLGNLDLGRRIHEKLNTPEFRKNVRICNTLIDMYVKCGCLDYARSVFNEMEGRSIVSWSAMISGLAMHGQAEEALQLFSKMKEKGMKPNRITFIGLLHACSHMGMVEKGQEFFSSMAMDYGIVPSIEHYGCMVDLYSRAGMLQMAYEFIMNMPINPNSVVWGALLGGCKVHKNIELAEKAISHLSKLDPLNDGYYVILSNIYAEAERWTDTARVRKWMKEIGVKKTPGWSSISINGTIHEFVAGDDKHPEAEEIHEMWEKLLQRMKIRGYSPMTSVVLLDVDEGEKVRFLYRHSEKLAVVYGLIKTRPGTPIRIMKNLRVCEDCHNAMKIISCIANREIVVGDRNRFHYFKDGSCSCRDFW